MYKERISFGTDRNTIVVVLGEEPQQGDDEREVERDWQREKELYHCLIHDVGPTQDEAFYEELLRLRDKRWARERLIEEAKQEEKRQKKAKRQEKLISKYLKKDLKLF